MRVAIVINTSWNIYNFRQGLIKALIDRGVEVIAIAPKDTFSDKLVELGCVFVPIRIDNRGVNPLKDTRLLFDFISLYRKINPDFILHFTIKPNIYGSIASGILGIPCVSNVSGLGTVFIRKGLLLFFVKYLYRFAFLFPQKVFFQNKDDRALFVDLGILKYPKSELLPGSGINLEVYHPLKFSRNDPFTFVLVARLLIDKGIQEFAIASRILKSKGLVFQSKIVGFFDRESKYNVDKHELDSWVKNGDVVFVGESRNIHQEFESSDCVVLPSYREGTPRSLLEAMASGKPIITTDVPGCREVLEEGVNGFFCEVRNPQSLANAMEKMMLLDADSLHEMGQNGRKIAENRFDERIVVEKYMMEIFAKFASK